MRIAAIILFSFACCMLLFGSLTDSWFKVEKEEAAVEEGREQPVRFGLLRAEVCRGSSLSCHSVSYADIGAADSESVILMRLTFVLGLLGAAYLCACAILIGLSVKAERGFAIGAVALSGACLLAALGVDVIRPRLLVELDASVGASFYLYILGAIGGIAGGVCGARTRTKPAPHEVPGDPRAHFPPELAAPPLPGAPRTAIPSPVPLPSPPVEPRPCTRCGNPARYVPGYRRHWCDGCHFWI